MSRKPGGTNVLGVYGDNAAHLWQCAQPADTDRKLPHELTASEVEIAEQLLKLAHFRPKDYRTVSDYLPLLCHVEARFVAQATIGLPTSKASNLERLPVETLNGIISNCDIAAIDQIKAVNRRLFELVNNHPQFKVVNEQAHDTLRSIRAVKNSHAITLQTLFETLCASQCEDCQDFGGYMHLITFRRVCWRCLMQKDEYSPMREMDAVKEFGLAPEMLSNLPQIQSYLDGSDTVGTVDYVSIIDRDAAYQAGIAHHGSHSAMMDYVATLDGGVLKRYEARIRRREDWLEWEKAARWAATRPSKGVFLKKQTGSGLEAWDKRELRGTVNRRVGYCFDASGPLVDSDDESINCVELDSDMSTDDEDYDTDEQHPQNKKHAQKKPLAQDRYGDDESRAWLAKRDELRFIKRLRFVTVTRVPWLNRRSRKEEWGFRCTGCRESENWPNHYERDYIMETFEKHLQECGPIKDGIHHKDGCCVMGVCWPRRSQATEQGQFYDTSALLSYGRDGY
ncbi:hypothetical protein AK830_g959 [Neonectria ditissima]|uniref:F-box domain-containing protein n=1 Tax=Neonectria ditissima TaxID=78410 RepID=A0A0N8H8V5_9HYPO|nr:hypothetical protein AK830_g959 [Neonectria ditissima]